MYVISSSFSPLYLVLIPVFREKGPEAIRETDRHCEVVDPNRKALVIQVGVLAQSHGGLIPLVPLVLLLLCSGTSRAGISGAPGDHPVTLEWSHEPGQTCSSVEWLCCNRHGATGTRAGGAEQVNTLWG